MLGFNMSSSFQSTSPLTFPHYLAEVNTIFKNQQVTLSSVKTILETAITQLQESDRHGTFDLTLLNKYRDEHRYPDYDKDILEHRFVWICDRRNCCSYSMFNGVIGVEMSNSGEENLAFYEVNVLTILLSLNRFKEIVLPLLNEYPLSNFHLKNSMDEVYHYPMFCARIQDYVGLDYFLSKMDQNVVRFQLGYLWGTLFPFRLKHVPTACVLLLNKVEIPDHLQQEFLGPDLNSTFNSTLLEMLLISSIEDFSHVWRKLIPFRLGHMKAASVLINYHVTIPQDIISDLL